MGIGDRMSIFPNDLTLVKGLDPDKSVFDDDGGGGVEQLSI